MLKPAIRRLMRAFTALSCLCSIGCPLFVNRAPDDITGLAIPSEDTIVASTANGKIIRSGDSGNQWQSFQVGGFFSGLAISELEVGLGQRLWGVRYSISNDASAPRVVVSENLGEAFLEADRFCVGAFGNVDLATNKQGDPYVLCLNGQIQRSVDLGDASGFNVQNVGVANPDDTGLTAAVCNDLLSVVSISCPEPGACTQRVWVSTNSGVSWSMDVRSESSRNLLLACGSDRTLWLVRTEGQSVRRYDSDEKTFVEVAALAENGSIAEVEANGDSLWIGVNASGGGTLLRVFQSGETARLPMLQGESVVHIRAMDDGTLVVGTYAKIFVLGSDGASWIEVWPQRSLGSRL